ncbi:TetR/AcrR family transcriptional regulator [Thalassomonas actiniarum]|uniref:TetR family transcriptional regulator n=1 Tax=Thalassomonas actiniarum TaxID=485447 RepID=A0AAE9YMR5_9GAMM|nr:TetR family transcriptional regulator [Thalassomonas actiniarum]WDD97098.1 TetR family transcriptional regulator [Thalassomonas actiniarum]
MLTNKLVIMALESRCLTIPLAKNMEITNQVMKAKKSRGEDTKNKILTATLKIIKAQGMRAVRHRAVATQAGVPLGSTTYHFCSIDDLISCAFEYWHQQIDVSKNPYFLAIADSIEQMGNTQLNEQTHKEKNAELLFQAADDYLKDQVIDHIDDRRIELAFHHEALRNPKLNALVLHSWQQEVAYITQFYKTLGSSAPEQDAEVTFALILQLEKKAMMLLDKDAQIEEYKNIRQVLKRHVAVLTGVETLTPPVTT